MDTQRSLPPIAHILHPPPSPSTSSPRHHHGKQHSGTSTSTSSSSSSYPTTCNCHPHSSQTPAPTMHLSPAPPISPCPSPTFPPQQQRSTPPQHNHAQQRYLSVPSRITTDTYNRTTTVRAAVGPPSPLSPTSTTGDDQKSATPSTSSMSLPPLQGDDPPRPLRTYRPMKHHGSSTYGRIFSSWDSSVTSPAPHYYGHYHHKELSPSPPPAPLPTPGTRSSARFPSHSRQVSSPSALQMTRPSAPPSPLPPPPHQPPVSYSNPAPSATIPVAAPRASRSASTADTTSRKRFSTEEATPPLTHSRTCSSASTASTHDEDVIMLERPRQNKVRPRATSSASCASAPERPPPPPSTQILFTATGEPILKRRRGRPPSLREPSWEGGWTFLTPTVWTVNSPAQQQLLQARDEDSSEDTAAMDGSMAAFTSASMDAVLQMPKKKRGRKPKTQIAGNSCFVWRDLTATRNASKKKNSNSNVSSSSSSKP